MKYIVCWFILKLNLTLNSEIGFRNYPSHATGPVESRFKWPDSWNHWSVVSGERAGLWSELFLLTIERGRNSVDTFLLRNVKPHWRSAFISRHFPGLEINVCPLVRDYSKSCHGLTDFSCEIIFKMKHWQLLT